MEIHTNFDSARSSMAGCLSEKKSHEDAILFSKALKQKGSVFRVGLKSWVMEMNARLRS